jgi:hypothetical protein
MDFAWTMISSVCDETADTAQSHTHTHTHIHTYSTHTQVIKRETKIILSFVSTKNSLDYLKN